MFYHDGGQLQYKVEVEKPNPVFARMLQQAIGGIEGEMRVAMQYLFQSWNSRGPKRYREMLLETGTEELAHVEMLATAVALNLEGADGALKAQIAKENPAVGAIQSGMDPRHYLSGGLGALAADSNGVPFNGSWVVSSGNLAADMISNANAEATGRALATRLYEFTDDAGMKDMLAFLIGRDTMHQQQWLAVIEELGGYEGVLPIPNSFPQELENQEFNYTFISTHKDGQPLTEGRWTSGPSLDGKGEYSQRPAQPLGGVPTLAPPLPQARAQVEQGSQPPAQGDDKSVVGNIVDKVMGND